MWYRKKIGSSQINYYQKKFDWFYLIGGIIGAIVLIAFIVPPA